MLVREAMTIEVVTVTPETTLCRAAALLADHHITSMPVVDWDLRLLGVISEADVMRAALIPDQHANVLLVPVHQGPAASYVGEIMTTMPVTVRPDANLADAVRVMTDSVLKSLPVTEEGRVVGVISRTDVVAQLAGRDDRVRAEIDTRLHDEGLDWSVLVVDGVVTIEGPESEQHRRLALALVRSVRGVTGVRTPSVRP